MKINLNPFRHCGLVEEHLVFTYKCSDKLLRVVLTWQVSISCHRKHYQLILYAQHTFVLLCNLVSWHELVQYLIVCSWEQCFYNEKQYHGMEELLLAVINGWKKIPLNVFHSLIAGMLKRFAGVLHSQGGKKL